MKKISSLYKRDTADYHTSVINFWKMALLSKTDILQNVIFALLLESKVSQNIFFLAFGCIFIMIVVKYMYITIYWIYHFNHFIKFLFIELSPFKRKLSLKLTLGYIVKWRKEWVVTNAIIYQGNLQNIEFQKCVNQSQENYHSSSVRDLGPHSQPSSSLSPSAGQPGPGRSIFYSMHTKENTPSYWMSGYFNQNSLTMRVNKEEGRKKDSKTFKVLKPTSQYCQQLATTKRRMP